MMQIETWSICKLPLRPRLEIARRVWSAGGLPPLLEKHFVTRGASWLPEHNNARESGAEARAVQTLARRSVRPCKNSQSRNGYG